jgi:hypothetical protein
VLAAVVHGLAVLAWVGRAAWPELFVAALAVLGWVIL